MSKNKNNTLQNISLFIFYGLLAYMPLHIFISTVIGANFGFLEALKVLKDAILVFGFCLLFVVSFTQNWFKAFLTNKLVLLIAAYATLTVVLALIRPTDKDAEILGIVFNLRFLLFFIYGWLLTYFFPVEELRRHSIRIVMSVGVIVVAFGIIQYVLLPNDALTHLGFVRSNGVLPAFFIDDKPNLERVMSTLRDPNSLGSYLLIIGSLITAAYLSSKQLAQKNRYLLYGISTLACMYFTFSRSAWVGLLITGLVFVALLTKTRVSLTTQKTAQVVVGTAALLLVVVGVLFGIRNTYFVQNVVFHADSSTKQEDPNQLRVRFINESINNIKARPLGSGPGTAGLASIKNQVQGTQLNENYYLQIASEVGILGLILFAAIAIMVSLRIYDLNPSNLFAVALLASFAGLAFTNLLVHIWSNEAVAYTWWGLAGLYVTTNNTIFNQKIFTK